MSSNTSAVPILANDTAGLRAISSFEDAARYLADAGVDVVNAADFGDGFDILPTKEKTRLVGQPFIILEYSFHPSKEFGGDFVAIRLVTKAGEKLILTDGSTGIREQLKTIAGESNTTQGLFIPRGLRASDYEYADPQTGEMRQARTYYLDY